MKRSKQVGWLVVLGTLAGCGGDTKGQAVATGGIATGGVATSTGGVSTGGAASSTGGAAAGASGNGTGGGIVINPPDSGPGGGTLLDPDQCGKNTTGVIRDFAFAMNVGVIVGTYSSIFIASPILIWLNEKYLALQKRQAARPDRGVRKPVRRGDEEEPVET